MSSINTTKDPILISRETLAERWDFKSTASIVNYENEGVLTRNPNLKVPRYYMEEVIKIEALREVNPLSPLERKRLEKKIEELEFKISFYEKKFQKLKTVLA